MRLSHAFPVLLVLLLSGCGGRNNKELIAPDTAAESAAAAAKERALRQQAALIAANLDDRQLAAQVIITGIDGRGQLPWHMRELLEECPAGGIMLFRYNLDTGNDAIKNLIAESSALAGERCTVGLPAENETAQNTVTVFPFIALDHEGGTVNRFPPGVADLPPAGSYWETAQGAGRESAIVQINADSFRAGKAMNDLGVTLNFAPVAEWLNIDNRDFLEDRSYGPDADFTAKAAAAFIMGMERAGLLCAVKHFPGSAGADPHRYPSVLPGDRAVLAELTAPFAALIQDGHARAVMVSHSLVPAWDDAIASLSPQVMDAWLRQEMGFAGIIICDDFSMAAGSQDSLSPETAALRSLAAGSDMVLVWPPDLRRTHLAILAALAGGTLSRERLREAAQRIIFEKLRMEMVEVTSGT